MASLMITTVVIDYWRNKKPRDVYELLRRIEIRLNEQHEAITRILDANPELDVPDSTRQMFSDNQ